MCTPQTICAILWVAAYACTWNFNQSFYGLLIEKYCTHTLNDATLCVFGIVYKQKSFLHYEYRFFVALFLRYICVKTIPNMLDAQKMAFLQLYIATFPWGFHKLCATIYLILYCYCCYCGTTTWNMPAFIYHWTYIYSTMKWIALILFNVYTHILYSSSVEGKKTFLCVTTIEVSHSKNKVCIQMDLCFPSCYTVLFEGHILLRWWTVKWLWYHLLD